MESVINIGPFAFPVGVLLLLGAVLASLAAAKWMGRLRDVEPMLWTALGAGVLGARTAFVVTSFDAYKSMPWSILDIRDGGFNAPAGILAAIAIAAWFILRSRERRKPLVSAALAGITVWVVGAAAAMMLDTEAMEMPQVTLAGLNGSPVQLKALAGKPMVVNLWATWCPPCRREMPVLRDAQAQFKDVVFVFANQGESAEAVRGYLDAEHLALDNVLLDPRLQLGSRTGSRALPTTLFINEKGIVVDRRIGELSAATLAQRIASLRSPGQ